MNHSLKKPLVIAATLILISVSIINVQAEESRSSVPKPSVGVLSEEVVRAQLSSLGYGEIQSIQRKDQYYVIKTDHGGRSVQVKVDATTGQLSEETIN
jgi:hypothetical protein